MTAAPGTPDQALRPDPADPPGPAADGAGPVRVTVRYFASARAAAGAEEERVTVREGSTGDGTPTPTVAAVLDLIREGHGSELTRVLSRCSFLLDGIAVHGMDTDVGDGDVIDVLPPFAGG